MMKCFTLVAVFFVLFFQYKTYGCPRRRTPSPRPPPPRKCEVNSWLTWSTCNHACGNDGEQIRTRTKSVHECCGGTCTYHLEERRACNRDKCKNGGTPRSGSCACTSAWTGTCCENGESDTSFLLMQILKIFEKKNSFYFYFLPFTPGLGVIYICGTICKDGE